MIHSLPRVSLAVLLGLTAVLPGWSQIRRRPERAISQIRGEVRFAGSGERAQHVLITLQSEDEGSVSQIQTDSQGKFEFARILQGFYTVSARYPAHRDAQERIDLTVTPTAYVVLELHPLKKASQAAVPPEGPAAAVPAGVPANAQKEYRKGQQLVSASKDPREGISHLQKAIEIHPRFAEAYLLLGTAQMDLENWKDAESALSRAIELNSNLGGAHLALGFALNRQGKFAESERFLKRGLELNPGSAQGHYELARSTFVTGRWQESEPHAQTALQLQPDLAAAHVLLGNVMLRKRAPEAALQEFKEYLRLEPNGSLAPATRDIVAKIEKALRGR